MQHNLVNFHKDPELRPFITLINEDYGGQGYGFHHTCVTGNGHNIYIFLLDTSEDTDLFKKHDHITLVVQEKYLLDWTVSKKEYEYNTNKSMYVFDWFNFDVIGRIKEIKTIVHVSNYNNDPNYIGKYKIMKIMIKNKHPNIAPRFKEGHIHEYAQSSSIQSTNYNYKIDEWIAESVELNW